MTDNADLKSRLFDALMTDDRGAARSLAAQQPKEFQFVVGLLDLIGHKPLPLAQLESDYPSYIIIPTAFTCNIGCPMCSSGFHDKTSLYDDRKYFLPSDLESVSPWLKTADYVQMVGVGETLDSPYIQEFLDKLQDKTTSITTSGAPLTKEKVLLFIQSGLHYLNLSFDGKTFLGHGGGNDKYIDKFWEKVEMIQRVKRDHHSDLPILSIGIAVSSENAGQLDDILATAWRHGIRLISMTPMVPRDANTYKKSIMADYETFQSDINIVLAKWTETGMTILASLKKWEMPDLPTSPPCPYIDNTLFINENAKSRCLCCGPLSLPMEPLNYPKNIFWNSFPLRYLRYLHLCLRTGDLPAVCNECWLMNTKLYADGLASRFSDGWNTENEEAYSLYRTASRLKQDGRT